MAIKTVHLSNLAIPPGEFLAEELEARDIAHGEFAACLNVSAEMLREIFCGERPITPKIAEHLETNLGMSAAYWLNAEASYRLTLANNFEVYGKANPFDGPESDWPVTDVEIEPDINTRKTIRNTPGV